MIAAEKRECAEYAKRDKRYDVEAEPRRRYEPGDIVAQWEGAEGVPCRAVAIRQYAHHVLCDVIAMHDGIWRRVYRESFAVRGHSNAGDMERAPVRRNEGYHTGVR